jgi:hypothetical protein
MTDISDVVLVFNSLLCYSLPDHSGNISPKIEAAILVPVIGIYKLYFIEYRSIGFGIILSNAAETVADLWFVVVPILNLLIVLFTSFLGTMSASLFLPLCKDLWHTFNIPRQVIFKNNQMECAMKS